MRDSMIINGNKLADYLQTINVSKNEFVDSLRQGEPFTLSNEEDGTQIAYTLDETIPLNIFARKVKLNYEQSRNFINKLGADVASQIIDWEAMNMTNPYQEQLFEHAFERLVKAIGKQRTQNAY